MQALPTDFQSFIHKSRYARWNETEGRREDWAETVERYIDNIVKPLDVCSDSTISAIRKAISSLDVMPSMRAMMTAGPAANRDNTCIYNCSYLPVDDPKSFDEAMFILLCGTGVGFSVERQYVTNLPEVPETLHKSDTTIVVRDSKEGWAKALRQLIALLYSGEIPKWDVSAVRPAGARLKTFGGRASGPAPLIDLFNFVTETFTRAVGRRLNALECHDIMCKIGEVVVVGGVRRSAMISLSNLTDDRLRHAKSGNWWETNPQRALANNSVCYTEKPDMETFIREWLALVESKSGERGIFNRAASIKQAAKNGRRDPNHEWGTNPCCVTGETKILTKRGYLPIRLAVGQKYDIWNGESWEPVIPYEAGVSDIIRVWLTDGSYLDCTPNHRWVIDGKFVTTDELKIGDKLTKFEMPVVNDVDKTFDTEAYSQGFYSGDGTANSSVSYVYEPKYACLPILEQHGEIRDDSEGRVRWVHGDMAIKSFVPINGTFSYKMSWLAGLLDADGTVTRDANGNGLQLVSVDYKFLLDLKLMLTTLGVRAKIVHANDEGYRVMPDGKGGSKEYYCKESHRILIGNTDTYNLVNLGLSCVRLELHSNPPQRDARRFVRVKEIIDLDRSEMTYCFTEPKTGRGTFNGIVTGNSEIILRPYEFCNLTEAVVRSDDTLATLKDKIEIASILGTIQSTYTKFPYLRKIWQNNCEEERLLGVSLTGVMDHKVMSGQEGEKKLAEWLSALRDHAVKVNESMAKKLGINVSAAITCNKPSGSVSQLVDCASGVHTRHSPYYIRTVRNDNKDPITKFMQDAGIPSEPCVMKGDTTTVFSFPIKAPKGSVTRNDMTAIEHLELWLAYQRHWCHHKPSVTITVRDSEWMDVGAFVYKNFDEISGVSFLPHSDHTYQQAPYQECSYQDYQKAAAAMPKAIDWANLADYESEDTTKGSQELACVAGACEIL